MPYRSPQTISSPTTAPTNIRYWVLGIFCAAAAIAYVQRYSMTLLAPEIRSDAQLNAYEMGIVMSGFFWGYALAQIPSGWLGVHWGSRQALAIFALTWSLATALMSVGWNPISLFCIWTLMGVAQAGLFPCAMIGLREWLPHTRRAVASGMLSMFMNVGAVLAPLLAAWLLLRHSWEQAFVWLSLPGIIWAVWYFWWYRDRPSEHKSVNAAEQTLIAQGTPSSDLAKQGNLRTPWRRLLTSSRMWLICAQHFLRAAAQVFFGTWFGTFLQDHYAMSPGESAFFASVPPLLLIVGSAVGGVLSDWLLHRTGSRRVSRQGLAVVNLLVCASMFLLASLAKDPYLGVLFISAGCLFMTIGGVSAYTVTMDVGGPHVAAVFSTMNMCGSIGAATFPTYAGWLVKDFANWNYVLWSIAAIYVAAAACWALLNPEGTLFDDREH